MVSGLYAVTPDTADTQWLCARISAALAGGARTVQYRNKTGDRIQRREQGEKLLQLCRAHDALLIVNDDLELARELDAHGVHLGRDDATVAQARAALGPDKMIGVSCYDSLARGMQAQEAGADYAAFGSVFASGVKPRAVRAPLSLLRQARHRLALPIVAIGGITIENAPLVIEAGAHALAVISALFQVCDTLAAAQAFCRVLEQMRCTPVSQPL